MGQKTRATRKIAILVAAVCIITAIGVASFLSALDSKDSAIADLNSTNSNSQNKIALDNSTINNLNSQIENLNSQITNLQTQIASLQAQNSSTSTQNLALQSQINSLNTQISNLNSQLNTLTTQNSSLTTQNAQLQSQISNLSSQLSTLNSQYKALNSSYNTLNTQYASLQDQLVGVLGIQNGTWLAFQNNLAITNYSYTNNGLPLSWAYTGIISVYNYGGSCTANIEIYGPQRKHCKFCLNCPCRLYSICRNLVVRHLWVPISEYNNFERTAIVTKMIEEQDFCCKICGAQVNPKQAFCSNCRRPLEWGQQPIVRGETARQQIPLGGKKQKNWIQRHEIIFAVLVIISVLGAVVIIGAVSSNSNNFFGGSTYKITADNAQYTGDLAASTATYVVYATVQNEGNSGPATFNCTLTLSDLSTVSQSQTVNLVKGDSQTISFTFYNLNWNNLPISFKFQWG